MEMEWSDREATERAREVARKLLKTARVRTAISEHSSLFAGLGNTEMFFERMVSQVKLASDSHDEAVILGDEVYRKFYILCAPIITTELNLQLIENIPNGTQLVSEGTADVFGLSFTPSNLDAFAEIRQNRDIRRYAGKFQEAILTAPSADDLQLRLSAAAREAVNTESIAKKARMCFETFGSIMTWKSPISETATFILGKAVDVAGRVAGYVERQNRWYTVGSMMQEVATKSVLAKHQFQDKR